MTRFHDCQQAGLAQLPTLPMPVVEMPVPSPIPYQTRVGHLISPPPELWIVSVAMVVALIVAQRRARRTFSAIACALFVVCVALAAGVVTLRIGAARITAGRLADAVQLMHAAAAPIEFLTWVQRWDINPAELLAENAAVHGMQDALMRGELGTAVAFADWPEARSAEGELTRSAVFTRKAAERLASGDVSGALYFAERAHEANVLSPVAEDAVSVAHAHLLMHNVARHNYRQARVHLRELKPQWRPTTHAYLAAYLAQQHRVSALAAQPPALQSALSMLDEAEKTANDLGQMPRAIPCDSALVLEELAIDSLGRKRAADAVKYLERAESYVRGSQRTAALFPIALHTRGQQEIDRGDGYAAVASLDAALARNPPDARPVFEDLISALVLRCDQQIDKHEFDGALASAERAHGISGASELTADALALAHFEYGDWCARTGSFWQAREHLEAAHVRPAFARESELLLTSLDEISERVQRLQRMRRWELSALPAGARLLDVDSDGRGDEIAYTAYDGSSVAWGTLANASQVVFTKSSDARHVEAVVRDTNGDQSFDERISVEGQSTVLMVDMDKDISPDVRLEFVDGKLVNEKALSGKIALIVHSAVVGGKQWDWWGEVDPYLLITKNGLVLLQSATVRESRFPVWSSAGTTIHYRHLDEIGLSLMEDDPLEDDELGSIEWEALPEVGRHYMTTSNGDVAVDVSIEPSTMPEGFRFTGMPRINAFHDPKAFADDSVFARIIRDARKREAETEVRMVVARIAATELLAVAIVPRANPIVQFGTAIFIDATAGEKIFATDEIKGVEQ